MALLIGYGTSGTAHHFLAFDAAGLVWNGAAYEAYALANLATYKIAAAEPGTMGRFTATAPAGVDHFELRENAAALAAGPVWAERIQAAAGDDEEAPGAVDLALVLTEDGTADGDPVADADVWLTSSVGGPVVQGTRQTDSLGRVTFRVDPDVTYYVQAQKDGWAGVFDSPAVVES